MEDDAATLARIAAGDRVAFGELYDRCAEAVFSWALHQTGRHREAEAVTAEVFAAVWRDTTVCKAWNAPVATALFALCRQRIARRRGTGARSSVVPDDRPAVLLARSAQSPTPLSATVDRPRYRSAPARVEHCPVCADATGMPSRVSSRGAHLVFTVACPQCATEWTFDRDGSRVVAQVAWIDAPPVSHPAEHRP